MSRFLKVLLIIGVLFSVSVPAMASWNNSDITNANKAEPARKNATDHGYKYGFGKCTFDPSADSDERTIAAHTCDLDIPNDAIITGAWYKVLTTFTSATDAATIAISVVSANDIFTATAISSGTTWDASTAIEGVPKVEDVSTWVETTSKSDVTFTVAVEALTAGKMVVWVQWLYYDDAT